MQTTKEEKQCGCKIETTLTQHGGYIVKSTPCQRHLQEQEQELKIRKERKHKKWQLNSEELSCDICKNHIGFVYNFDIEGSYFLCDECKGINN